MSLFLFYSRLCPSTAGRSPPPESSNFFCPLLSLSILLPFAPQCPLLSHNVIYPTPFRSSNWSYTLYTVLLIVHLLSFIWAMCSAHFHFILAVCWTMSVTQLLCLKMMLRILSCSLILSTFLSMAHWLVSSFFGVLFESTLYREIFLDMHLPMSLKRKDFNQCVVPAMKYMLQVKFIDAFSKTTVMIISLTKIAQYRCSTWIALTLASNFILISWEEWKKINPKTIALWQPWDTHLRLRQLNMVQNRLCQWSLCIYMHGMCEKIGWNVFLYCPSVFLCKVGRQMDK